MSSSKTANSFSSYLQTNDFIELAQQARAKKQEIDKESKTQAAKPNISEDDIQAAERKSFEQGVEEGKQEALLMLRSEMEENIATIRAKFDNLEPMKEELSALLETEMLSILKHILKKTFYQVYEKFNQDLLQAALKTALLEVQDQTKLTIRTNKETKTYLNEVASDTLSSWKISWKEDERLDKGACLLEWDNQGLDLRLDRALKEVDNLLEGALASAALHKDNLHSSQPSTIEAPNNEPTNPNKPEDIDKIEHKDTPKVKTEEA